MINHSRQYKHAVQLLHPRKKARKDAPALAPPMKATINSQRSNETSPKFEEQSNCF